MKREERTDDITCIVAFIEAPPDAPRKAPKYEPPPSEGDGQGRKRVIQRRFNVGVLEAISERKASTL